MIPACINASCKTFTQVQLKIRKMLELRTSSDNINCTKKPLYNIFNFSTNVSKIRKKSKDLFPDRKRVSTNFFRLKVTTSHQR